MTTLGPATLGPAMDQVSEHPVVTPSGGPRLPGPGKDVASPSEDPRRICQDPEKALVATEDSVLACPKQATELNISKSGKGFRERLCISQLR